MIHSPIPPDPGGEGESFELQQNEDKRMIEDQKKIRPTANVVEMIQLWILICFQYIALYLNKFGDVRKLRNNHLKAIEERHEDETIIDTETEVDAEDFSFPTILQFRPARPISLTVEDTDISIPETTHILLDSVTQTSYITTIFEANRFGLSTLTSDVMEEMSLWFEKKGLLAIACEMVWNVPMKYRDRMVESQLKDGLFKFLRANNRRVLDSKWKDKSLPITFPDSTTQEVSGHEQKSESFQGIYRRFYGELLPYQHKDTQKVHSPFWFLEKSELRANPEKFLLGNNRRFNELTHTTLVALNLITLKVKKD